MTKLEKKRLRYDAFFISLSVGVAFILVWSDLPNSLLVYAGGIKYIESFIAGVLFTSVFTTAPAIVILGEIAQHSTPLSVAVFGGLGALFGDLILFRFIKDRVSEDLLALIGQDNRGKVYHIAERRIFRWFSPLIAAFIIASPLPDELGIMFLGLARTKTFVFILFSFAANFLGILVIAGIATLVG
jgi:hypothetical protein